MYCIIVTEWEHNIGIEAASVGYSQDKLTRKAQTDKLTLTRKAQTRQSNKEGTVKTS